MTSAYPNAPYGAPYQDAADGHSIQEDGPSSVADVGAYQPNGSTSGDSSAIDPESHPRKCSVRGCMTIIPSDTANKMCEACRGRHRVYAMTKRAKRKLEKDALAQQSVALLSTEQPPGTVWLPENPQLDEEEAEPWLHRSSVSVEPEASASHTPSNAYSASHSVTWDHSVIDPNLVNSQSSELAGALTLPSKLLPPSAFGPAPPPEADTDNHDVDAPYIAPAQAPGTDQASSSSRPGRPCSVKGCKATIPADYFFKMCEPCRERYKGYGITKRAKWRAERIAANAELEALRIEEDTRRADEGLPPLSECPEDWITWQNDIVDGPLLISTEDKHGAFPTRMCTVSHCHVILSGEYKYRRCEQHRLQNRHHSKLKRVREKEEKAQANALVDAAEAADETFQIWTPKEPTARKKDKDEEPGPLFTRTPIGGDRPSPGESVDTGEMSTDIVSRRKSHICSIKDCQNLLGPGVPWKMCDMCRERDRENRKNKKLREINKLPPLRNRIPSAIPKRRKKKDQAAAQATATSNFSGEHVSEPVSMLASSSTASLDQTGGASFEFVNADQSTFEGHRPVSPGGQDEAAPIEDTTSPSPDVDPTPIKDVTTESISSNTSPVAGSAPATVSVASEELPPKKRRRVTKPKKKASDLDDGSGATASSPPAPPPAQSISMSMPPGHSPYAHPYGPHGQPPYPMPYYMPSPFYNPHPSMQPPPIASGSTSAPPPATSQPGMPLPASGSAPVPMYPYPYSYPPYPPRPGPYGQYPYPYPPYGMPMGQPPYGYGPPPAPGPPPAQPKAESPKVTKPYKRKPRKNWLSLGQDGGEVSSFTSVFSAVPSPPTLRPGTSSSLQSTSALPTPTLRPILLSNGESIIPSDTNLPSAEAPTSTLRPIVLSNAKITTPSDGNFVKDATPPQGPEQEPRSPDIDMAEPETVQVATASRSCAQQSCQRSLPAGSSGNICERCLTRARKMQTNAKRRYKLEPKVSITRLGAR